MIKEIDILLRASSKGCLIVDRESHVLLEEEELFAAQRDGLYQGKGELLAPGKGIELSGPFPGCMQLGGDSKRFTYQMVGQTEHFAIFYPVEGQAPLGGLGRDYCLHGPHHQLVQPKGQALTLSREQAP
jgi:hypothetical protein